MMGSTSFDYRSTFFRGASLGGSKMTISHDSFLEIAPFINALASSFTNDNIPGSMLLRAIFSLASSIAPNDESTPDEI